MKKTLCSSLLFVLLFSINQSYGQVDNLYQLIEAQKLSGNEETPYSLEELALGNVPTNYVVNGEQMIRSDQPIRIAIDAKSLDIDWNDLGDLSKVSILNIQIHNESELEVLFHLDELNRFINLKYIYVNSAVELCSDPDDFTCEKEEVSRLFTGSHRNEVRIVYSAGTNQ